MKHFPVFFFLFLFVCIGFSAFAIVSSCEDKKPSLQSVEAEAVQVPVPEPDIHGIAKAYLEKVIQSSEWGGYGTEVRLEAIRIYLRYFPQEKEGR